VRLPEPVTTAVFPESRLPMDPPDDFSFGRAIVGDDFEHHSIIDR